MTKLRATLIYMLKEKEPQINKTKHRLLRGILMEKLKEIGEQTMNKSLAASRRRSKRGFCQQGSWWRY